MRNFKSLLIIAALLVCGGTVASASPILEAWIFVVDGNLFGVGGQGDLNSPAGNTQSYGDTTATMFYNVDSSGLGSFEMALSAPAGTSHTVALWAAYAMTTTECNPLTADPCTART